MPKYRVIGRKVALSRVVFEVEASSSLEAKIAVEYSDDPHAEFEEVGDFDVDQYDVTVERVEKL